MRLSTPPTRSAAPHTQVHNQHSSDLNFAVDPHVFRLGRPTPVSRLRLRLACGEGLHSSRRLGPSLRPMQDLALVYCRSDPRPVRVAIRLEPLETSLLATLASRRRHSQEIPEHENFKVAGSMPGCV